VLSAAIKPYTGGKLSLDDHWTPIPIRPTMQNLPHFVVIIAILAFAPASSPSRLLL
jgi:hypothetical protein